MHFMRSRLDQKLWRDQSNVDGLMWKIDDDKSFDCIGVAFISVNNNNGNNHGREYAGLPYNTVQLKILYMKMTS